ncbi:tellurium resistance protein [Mycolicibacterium austroafricanum]|uniref:Tellurium resistance protein n=1 Tax=Mycolicibacterium austroafricanum TaxID=39687 RepID=A0ABT8HKG9_MYCAO|nr:tellurium resistance protein [Mycolicibacterium austroafricanum]MDN4521258.1 tellurium resistance protein [Mycolicibacterium austroafricanum]QRZ08148.1 tellurium resistance protein [Mycolicibacterium austroafricanum]QZT69812.1 tellurium resistance protein [Mycolicibacterium austroafricanum]
MGIDYTKRPSTPQQQPAVPQPGPPTAGPLNLSKISLTKAAPAVNLTKSGERQGLMRINLNWTSGAARKGFFGGGGSRAVDLDLGCLYELTDGSKGVIQALGNSFGARDRAPYISLDGDDRTGAAAGGENMYINLQYGDRFRRILIFAMIYEGAANWAAVDGVVTMFPTSGPQIEVRLDSPQTDARICAIAQVYTTGSGLAVHREDRYISGSQSDLDRAYGWGMQWTRGRK